MITGIHLRPPQPQIGSSQHGVLVFAAQCHRVAFVPPCGDSR
jgi:hypothetical protein